MDVDDAPLKENISEKEILGDSENNKSHKKIIISSIVIFLALVIVVIVLIFTVFKKPDEDNEPRSLLEKLKKYPTPYYYYNTTLLNQTIDEIIRLSKEHDLKIHFSLKSNFNEKVVNLFASHPEIGADCVSGGEVEFALQKFPKDKIVFAGIGKTDEEIENAVNNSIFCINVESFEELENLNDICNRLKKPVNFGVRINPNIEAHTHEKIITGNNETKFGIYIDECEKEFYDKIEEIFKKTNPNYQYLNFIGLHFHIGSQILNFTDYVRLCKKIDKYVDGLNERNISITYLNLGGGLGIDYDEPTVNPMADFEGYFNTYLTNLTCLQKVGPNYVKKGIKKSFAILDAGMNDLIRPAMYGALHQIERVEPNNELAEYDVVGPICESSDVFAKNYTMDKLDKNDYVIIRSAGAYGESMASRYNFRKVPLGYMDWEF